MRALATLVLLSGSTALQKGEGCDKKIDKVCPDWKDHSVASCLECVDANVKKLEPNCTKAKAENKCKQLGPTPSVPTPSSPTPPTPASPTPAPATKGANFVFVLTDDQDIMLG
jgi:hypothetical protein